MSGEQIQAKNLNLVILNQKAFYKPNLNQALDLAQGVIQRYRPCSFLLPSESNHSLYLCLHPFLW